MKCLRIYWYFSISQNTMELAGPLQFNVDIAINFQLQQQHFVRPIHPLFVVFMVAGCLQGKQRGCTHIGMYVCVYSDLCVSVCVPYTVAKRYYVLIGAISIIYFCLATVEQTKCRVSLQKDRPSPLFSLDCPLNGHLLFCFAATASATAIHSNGCVPKKIWFCSTNMKIN